MYPPASPARQRAGVVECLRGIMSLKVLISRQQTEGWVAGRVVVEGVGSSRGAGQRACVAFVIKGG